MGSAWKRQLTSRRSRPSAAAPIAGSCLETVTPPKIPERAPPNLGRPEGGKQGLGAVPMEIKAGVSQVPRAFRGCHGSIVCNSRRSQGPSTSGGPWPSTGCVSGSPRGCHSRPPGLSSTSPATAGELRMTNAPELALAGGARTGSCAYCASRPRTLRGAGAGCSPRSHPGPRPRVASA